MDEQSLKAEQPLGSRGGRYHTPGVYYEEQFDTLESLPLHTGVPAFIGFSGAQNADHTERFVYFTRWKQFEARFGNASPDGFLGEVVRGFFENGGARCAVVPVHSSAKPAEQRAALMKPFEEGGVLEELEDVDLVCVPDAMTDSLLAFGSAVLDIQTVALDHCGRMRERFAILDTFPGYMHAAPAVEGDDPKGIKRAASQWEALPPREGALYFPWVRVMTENPEERSTAARPAEGNRRPHPMATRRWANRSKLVPPCGHVAGVYSRVDADVGVHKAPANELLEGVVDLAAHLDDREQAGLNDRGVNCLRSFPGRGIRVWGARTLSGQPNWRYVNVSRLFLTLARWLQHGLNEFVFEPNDPSLWNGVRDRLSSYCLDLFERGALRGTRADQAFFVKCDAETNPLEIREAGGVIAEVGLAPLAPAEFIIVNVTRRVSGATFTLPTTL